MPVVTSPHPESAMRSNARRPRFARSTPPPLRLTADDIAVLQHVAKHRFLRSTHLVPLLARSPKKLVERLGLLYHAGFLDRPRAQLDYYATVGSAPMVYALGNRGAAALAEIHGSTAPKVDWTDKNRTARRPFIEHTLLIADVMVAVELAVRTRPDLRLMEASEILALAPEATRRSKSPWRLTTRLPVAGLTREIGLIPDKVFGLDFTAERKRSYFFLEADRATMPVHRAALDQTSFARKLLTYWQVHRAAEHTRQFGIGNFRVLTVTSSRERVASMVTALRQVSGGMASYMFLFAARADLMAATDILDMEWITGKGDRLQIYRKGATSSVPSLRT